MAGDTHHEATVYRVRYGGQDHDLITSIAFGSVWDPNDETNIPNDKAITSALPPYQQQKLERWASQTTTNSEEEKTRTPVQKIPLGSINRKRKSPDEADTSSSSNSSSEGVDYIEFSSSSDDSSSSLAEDKSIKEVALKLARGIISKNQSCAEKRKLKSPSGGRLKNVKKKHVTFCDKTLAALGEQYRSEMMQFMRDMVISDHSDDETDAVGREGEQVCTENIEITDLEAVDNRLLSNSMLAVL